jgi:hypothetical protein
VVLFWCFVAAAAIYAAAAAGFSKVLISVLFGSFGVCGGGGDLCSGSKVLFWLWFCCCFVEAAAAIYAAAARFCSWLWQRRQQLWRRRLKVF